MSWRDVLEHWLLVVLDLSEIHHIDVETTDLPWPALRDRIIGLLSRPSRLQRELLPASE